MLRLKCCTVCSDWQSRYMARPLPFQRFTKISLPEETQSTHVLGYCIISIPHVFPWLRSTAIHSALHVPLKLLFVYINACLCCAFCKRTICRQQMHPKLAASLLNAVLRLTRVQLCTLLQCICRQHMVSLQSL